jgi:hypothetical protein
MTRIKNLCNQLINKVGFELYTVYMTPFDATEHNLSVSLFPYFWTIVLLLNTFLQEWSLLVSLCNELDYFISFDLCTVSLTFFDAT